jgi:hypothetical protein
MSLRHSFFISPFCELGASELVAVISALTSPNRPETILAEKQLSLVGGAGHRCPNLGD